MTNASPAGDWTGWAESWRGDVGADQRSAALVARTRSAIRGRTAIQLLSTAVAAGSVGVVATALRHAGNAFEATLGIVVGVGIVAVWFAAARNRHAEQTGVSDAPERYEAARVELCHRQRNFARLGWAVAALDLVFLVPWWVGGIAVHGRAFNVGQLLTIWTPLAIIIGFASVCVVLWKRAGAELRWLDRTSAPVAGA